MRAARSRGVNALALAVAALIGACAASGQSASSPTPTSVTTGDGTTYAAAVAEVQAYFDMWAKDGPYAAAARYLVPEEQLPACATAHWPPASAGPCGDVPVLLSGKVESGHLRSWTSSDEFTLLVTVDLHFRADPTRWNANEGTNSRFVTFTRPNAGGDYRMYLATGP
jgi:hypothetical protein